jgi:transposase-like protein
MLMTKLIPNCEIETILPMVEKWIQPGSMVVTDEARFYHSLRRDYFHVSVNHSEGQYTSGCFTTNGLENFWSIFKRSIIGTFHNISPQHIQKYADELSFRYNNKGVKNSVLFEKAIRSASKVRVTYKTLTSDRQRLFSKD